MKMKSLLMFGAALCGCFLPVQSVLAQGTAFTYQGRLTDGGNPYTGNVEFQPSLWDAASGGAQVAANAPASLIVGVTNGLFTLPLDFGANFPGTVRWLQIEVRTTLGRSRPLRRVSRLRSRPMPSPPATSPARCRPALSPAVMQTRSVSAAN